MFRRDREGVKTGIIAYAKDSKGAPVEGVFKIKVRVAGMQAKPALPQTRVPRVKKSKNDTMEYVYSKLVPAKYLLDLDTRQLKFTRSTIPLESQCSHLQGGRSCRSGNCYIWELGVEHPDVNAQYSWNANEKNDRSSVLPRIWNGQRKGRIIQIGEDQRTEWLVCVEGCKGTLDLMGYGEQEDKRPVAPDVQSELDAQKKERKKEEAWRKKQAIINGQQSTHDAGCGYS